MTTEEAISILENAAFLATKTDFQSICEALEIVKKALKKQDFPTQMSGTSGEDANVSTKTEENIKTLKLMQAQVEWEYPMDYAAAIDEAVIRVGAFDQIKWERDIAIEQLKQLGYSLGEKPKEHYWIKCRGEVKCPVCGHYDACVDSYCRHCGTKMNGIRKE